MPSGSTPRAPRWIVALPAPLLAAALGGCTSHAPELARVGSRVITTEDFVTVARANTQQYPGTAEQARRMLMEDLVRRDLMLAAADGAGLSRDSATVALRRQTEDQVLAGALYRSLAPSDIAVSAGGVDSFYRWRGIETRIRLLSAANRPTADAAMNALHAGDDFGTVADRFTPTRMLPPGGELGYLQPGALVDPLDGLLRTGPLRVLIGPLEAPGEGWFIVQLLDRRAVKKRPRIDLERPYITSAIQQRKQRSASSRAFTDLAARYHVTVVPGAAQQLFMIANRQTFGHDTPRTPEQLRGAVVQYEDASGRRLAYTLGEALKDLQARPGEGPNFMMLPAIETWLQSQGVQRAAVIEARRRHLHEEPAIARQIQERVNNQVLERVYNEQIGNVGDPTEEEIRAVYERRRTGYIELDAVHLLHVTFADSAAAAGLLRHGGHSGTLRDAARMAGVANRVIEERVRFPNPKEPWKSMQAAFISMQPDEWTGPIRAPGGWMVLQVLDKDQSPQAYEKLVPAIQQSIRDEALTLRRDRRLAQFTDSMRAVIRPLVVHPERLERIPWPVPPAGAMSGS